MASETLTPAVDARVAGETLEAVAVGRGDVPFARRMHLIRRAPDMPARIVGGLGP